MASLVSELFDRILLLEEGETIILKFHTEEDLKSKKVLLFREKEKYEKKMSDMVITRGIVIRQEVRKATQVFKLMISTSGSKMDWLNDAVLRTKDGDEKKLMQPKTDERVENLKKKDMK